MQSIVGPWIARDIENTECCEVDEILKLFLLDCVDESLMTEDLATLFEVCIEHCKNQKVTPKTLSMFGLNTAHEAQRKQGWKYHLALVNPNKVLALGYKWIFWSCD